MLQALGWAKGPGLLLSTVLSNAPSWDLSEASRHGAGYGARRARSVDVLGSGGSGALGALRWGVVARATAGDPTCTYPNRARNVRAAAPCRHRPAPAARSPHLATATASLIAGCAPPPPPYNPHRLLLVSTACVPTPQFPSTCHCHTTAACLLPPALPLPPATCHCRAAGKHSHHAWRHR